jgi:biotin-dependent carboxylase-like uncharacterized protein
MQRMTHAVSMEVVNPGWLCTLQDLGRRGSERLGVATGGAADQYSAAVGNILVGNGRNATLLEITGSEFAVRVESNTLFAVTGAPTTVEVDGEPVSMWQAVFVTAGAVISLRLGTAGLRAYLCFAGELETARFLGSAAPDARMGFGQQVRAGDRLNVSSPFRVFVRPDDAAAGFGEIVDAPDFAPDPWRIPIVEGPEVDRVPGIRELLTSSHYTVKPQSDHIGLRLDGPVLHSAEAGEIVSHGVPIGAVEIPPSDELIVLGRARSLTAGYPVVAIVSSAGLSLLGQAAPGRVLTFEWVSREDSVARYRAEQRELDALESRVRSAFELVGLPVP